MRSMSIRVSYVRLFPGAMLDIGRGRGPMNPLFDLQSAFIDEKQS